MRILLLSHGYPPFHSGGYELRCRDIATQLAARGHEIEIITTLPPGRNAVPTEPGIARRFHDVRGATPTVKMLVYSYQDIRLLDRKIKKFSPEIIYLSHVINLTRHIFPYLAQLDIPIVYDEGGNGLTYAWINHRWFNSSPNILKSTPKLAIRHATQRLTGGLLKAQWDWPRHISAFFNNPGARRYAKTSHVPLAACQTILPAVDLDLFRVPPRQCLDRPIKILVAGRLEETKGVHDALDWYEALQKAGISAQFLIVGKKVDETYYQGILTRIAALNAGDFQVLPQVSYDEMAVFYQQNDICFFPSYHWQTGLSRVPLEAMASGCVILSYGAESSKDIIQHGKTGFVVEPRDWDTMGDIIRKLTNDQVMYQDVVHNAREYVQTNHSFARYIDQIEQFLLNARRFHDSE